MPAKGASADESCSLSAPTIAQGKNNVQYYQQHVWRVVWCWPRDVLKVTVLPRVIRTCVQFVGTVQTKSDVKSQGCVLATDG